MLCASVQRLFQSCSKPPQDVLAASVSVVEKKSVHADANCTVGRRGFKLQHDLRSRLLGTPADIANLARNETVESRVKWNVFRTFATRHKVVAQTQTHRAGNSHAASPQNTVREMRVLTTSTAEFSGYICRLREIRPIAPGEHPVSSGGIRWHQALRRYST